MLSFPPTRKFGDRRLIQIRWVLFFSSTADLLPFVIPSVNAKLKTISFARCRIFLCLAGPLRASWRSIIRRSRRGVLSTVLFPSFPQAYFLHCGVLAKPDWTHEFGACFGGSAASPAAGLFSKAPVSVYLILLLLCVFAYLTADLALTVLYLSSPLRKLLQYLWLLCNSECACAFLWMQDSGKSGVHLTELFSLLLNFILLWVCLVAL